MPKSRIKREQLRWKTTEINLDQIGEIVFSGSLCCRSMDVFE